VVVLENVTIYQLLNPRCIDSVYREQKHP